MPIAPNLKRLSQFDTTGDGLKRGVSQLEDNVAAALGRIAQQATPLASPTSLHTADVTALLDQVVVASGTFAVTLPVATSVNAGRRISDELEAGTVTVKPTTGLVQGAATDVRTTAGRYEYMSDGVGWWRPPVGAGGGGSVSSVTSGGAGITVSPTTGAVVVTPTLFGPAAAGDVPASGGGTAKFLRADGTWQTPASGGLSFTQFSKDIGRGTSGHFDLTGLSGLTAGKDVLLVQTAQPIASKGNARDEFEMDSIELTGYVVDATTIRAYWQASGIVVGTYNFAYQVGA